MTVHENRVYFESSEGRQKTINVVVGIHECASREKYVSHIMIR